MIRKCIPFFEIASFLFTVAYNSAEIGEEKKNKNARKYLLTIVKR